MLRLVLFVFLFTSGMEICRAKLGETEAQCIARYGQEFDVHDNLGFDIVGDKAVSFNLKTSKEALVLKVTFLNGMDVLEKITNGDGDISDDQKQAILQSESASLQWNKQNTSFHTDRSDVTAEKESWLRSDGADATCWSSGKVNSVRGWVEIDLSTKEYAVAQRNLDRQNGAR